MAAAKKGDEELALVKREPQEDSPSAVSALRQILKPSWMDLLDSMADRPSKKPSTDTRRQPPPPPDWQSPVYVLLAAQAASYLLFNALDVAPAAALGLNLKAPQWWQFITSAFAFSSWQHAAETVFMTYVFGRLLERSHGAFGIWLCFLASVIGANAMALWLLPSKVAVTCFAASAGAFGLFVAGLFLPRLISKPLEVVCLAPLVCTSIITQHQALSPLLAVQGLKLGHLVHAAGAAVGGTIVWAILAALTMYKVRIEREREELVRQERLKRQQEQATAMAQALGTAAKAATDVAKKLF